MEKPAFDPLDPPTARNPLPAYGSAPSMRLLQDLVRVPRQERTRPLTPESRAMLVEIAAALSASLIPATAREIRDAVLGLLSHYPTRAMSTTERVSVARDWLTDLAVVPTDIIAAACQEWRRRPNAFAPTPGHLLELIGPVLAVRRFQHRMASEWLAAQHCAVNEDQRKGIGA